MSISPAECLRVAEQAAAAYGIEAPTLQLLGHSDNLTLKVLAGQGGPSFLLRLHHPRTQTFAGVRQQPRAIVSELQWLEALAQETSISVQRPMCAVDGALVASVTTPDGTAIPCSLLQWLDGAPLDPAAAQAPQLAEALGRLVARLHDHAASWQPPATFYRPTYDTEYIAGISAGLARGIELGVIQPGHYAVLRETLELSSALLEVLGQSSEHWGLIHNDLHPANCLVYGVELRPIDFALCGCGYFVFDLGTVLGSLPVALRPVLLQGYLQRRSLPRDHLRLVEAGFMISRMSSYLFALPDGTQQDWLRRRIPEVANTLCRRFLSQHSFLFELR